MLFPLKRQRNYKTISSKQYQYNIGGKGFENLTLIYCKLVFRKLDMFSAQIGQCNSTVGIMPK